MLSAFVPATEDIDLETFAEEPTSYFLVGVALERADDSVIGDELLADQLVGATAMYRVWNVGFGGRLLFSPDLDRANVVQIRLLLGADLRIYHEFFGIEWSYGIGALAETRLADHFWLTYVTPAELGATVYQSQTFSMRVFAGVRYLASGTLVNSFLIDPNGFDNENAADALQEEKDNPLEGFVRIVFARRI